ncbi:MAG: pyridoxal-phosphate-dependent aminotransferase family protein [Vulcanimicrobiaceae bacterium]
MSAESLLFLPGPVMVAPEVLAAQQRPLMDHRGPVFAEILNRCSARLAPIFGTNCDVVLLGSSGTGGLEAAVANLISPGERWLAAPVGVFGKRLAAIAKTYGAVVEELPTDAGACMNPEAFSRRLADDRDREIRGVLLTHNETSTGVQNDLAAIAPALRAHGALSIVDSVSGLAASLMQMDAWGFDIVVSASQKALAAPPGVAMLAVSERAWATMEHATAPRWYFDLRMAREFVRKGQTPWTPPISIIYALDAALECYVNEGPVAFLQRHVQRAALVRARLQSFGFTFF